MRHAISLGTAVRPRRNGGGGGGGWGTGGSGNKVHYGRRASGE